MLALSLYRKSSSSARIVFLIVSLSLAAVAAPAQTELRKPTRVFGFGMVDDVAYSPDGAKIAVASHNVVGLFDSSTGARLGSIIDPIHSVYQDPRINSISFSNDGKLLAIGDDQGVATIWDVDVQLIEKTITVNDGRVTAVAFSPDGNYLLTGTSYGLSWETPTTGSLKLYNAETGSLYRTFTHTFPIKAVAYSPIGTQVVSANAFGGTFLWSTTQNDYVRIFDGTPNVTCYDVAFSPDGEKVAGVVDDQVFLWNTSATPQIHAYTDATNHAYSVAFATDGGSIVVGGYTTAKRWSITPGYGLLKSYDVGQAYAQSVAFSPNPISSRVLAASNFWGGEIKVFDTNTSSDVLTIHGQNRGIYSIAVSSDGQRLVTGADSYSGESAWESSQVKIYDMATGTELASLPDTGGMTSVDISPDGDTILTASFGGNGLKLWTIEGEFIRELTTESASCACFAMGDSKVLTGVSAWNSSGGVYEGVVSVFDTLTGEKDDEFRPLGGDISCIAVAPDADRRTFVGGTGAYGGLAYLRNLTKTLSRDFPVDGWVDSVAMSSDAERVLTGTVFPNGAQLWDVASGSKIRDFDWDGRAVGFWPDDLYVVTAGGWALDSYGDGGFGRVQIWNSYTGVLLKIMQAQRGFVQDIAFTWDGGILSGSEDGSVMLWDKVVTPTAADAAWSAYE